MSPAPAPIASTSVSSVSIHLLAMQKIISDSRTDLTTVSSILDVFVPVTEQMEDYRHMALDAVERIARNMEDLCVEIAGVVVQANKQGQ